MVTLWIDARLAGTGACRYHDSLPCLIYYTKCSQLYFYLDGPRPIRTVGVYSHRNQSDNSAKRIDQGPSVRWGFTPTAINRIIQQSGWTKAHPYGGGLLPCLPLQKLPFHQIPGCRVTPRGYPSTWQKCGCPYKSESWKDRVTTTVQGRKRIKIDYPFNARQ